MLINPSYEELYNVQEHGIKPNAYNPSDYLRMVSKVFSTFGDKNVYQNTNSYINGFVVDYSYQFLKDDTLTADELKQLSVKGGVLIQDVRASGIAAQARIQPGDVVTQVNNKAVNNAEDFVKVISELKNGSIARVSLIRQGQRAIVGMRIQ